MEVVKYLKEHGVEKLKEELAIIVKEYDDVLVLNYDQIRSPKTHQIVRECRGLILDKEFNIVSRSFDRFYNLHEAPETQTHLDFSKAVCHEKVDGSLIKIYNFHNTWFVSTRGTAFAESACNMGPKFYELVWKALGVEGYEEFEAICERYLDPEWTYIFELTSVENRVVKHYTGYTLHYLASRHNQTGEYGDWHEELAAFHIGANTIKRYEFDSVESCVEAAKSLPDLEEGYVIYQDGKPVCKVKSPAYLAVHAIRGEGLTPKRIMQLVLMNEQDEYLSYFPEDKKFFEPYLDGLDTLFTYLCADWLSFGGIEDQKDFASRVKDTPYSAVLFQARVRNEHPINVFHAQRENYKLKVLEVYVDA